MAAIIMCPRVDGITPDPELDPDERACSDCGAPIWVSRSSRDLMAQRPCILVCNPCAGPRMVANLERHPGLPVPIGVAPGADPGFLGEVAETIERLNRERSGG